MPRLSFARTSALAFALVLAACSVGGSPNGEDGRLRVVATTTILADLAANVGGERVAVFAIVPAGGEVHTFDPAPSDLSRITSADIVLANGLGLDEWVEALVIDANSSAPLIAIGEELPGVAYRESDEHGVEAEDHEDGEGHAGIDPHIWLNAAHAARYVERIRDELTQLDPSGTDAYAANTEAYLAELGALDAELRDTFAAIPDGDRRLVSYHDAFGYFADAYGLAIVGTVTSAPGQDPSAGQVAALIDEIRALGVRAILAEAQFPTDLAERIAEETGIAVITDLYSDSVGPPPADSYLALMRSDAERIAAALR